MNTDWPKEQHSRLLQKNLTVFGNLFPISGITGYLEHMVSDEALMLDFQARLARGVRGAVFP
jgi:hypothetical protein